MPDINVNKLSEALNTKADIDLNNTGVFSTNGGGVNLISSTPADASGKEVTSADFIKTDIQSNLLNYTTNRILEIPQNIRYSIEMSTVGDSPVQLLKILKGTKYYVPDGFEADGTTPKFTVLTLENDNLCPNQFLSDNTLDVEMVFIYFKDNQPIIDAQAHIGANVTSGPTAPTTFLISTALWYDTTTNYIKYTNDSGTTWYTASFPLLIGQPIEAGEGKTGGWVNGVKDVFNGFGFIGSTSFALPGVKYQIADGKNDDGTFKTVTKISDKVTIRNNLVAETGEAILFLTDDFESYAIWQNNYHISLSQPNDQEGSIWFDNYQHYQHIGSSNSLSWVARKLIPVYRYSVSAGVITKLAPYQNNSINSYQRTELAGMGMPGDKFIDLTLGASNTTYTAPANGWFFMDVGLTGTTGAAQLACGVIGASAIPQTDVSPSYAFLPVYAGNVVKLTYGLSAKFNAFRFIYAQGEQ